MIQFIFIDTFSVHPPYCILRWASVFKRHADIIYVEILSRSDFIICT
jgi:hypothetical protein